MHKALFLIILLAFSLVCLSLSFYHPFNQSMEVLLQDVWFKVILGDLYIGLFLFYLFILCLEKRALPRVIWLIALVACGNLASLVFLLLKIDKISIKYKS